VTAGTYRFDRFELDCADRRLLRDGEPLELSSRYLDALALMLSEPGRLVSKDRFLDEVWRGVPVTDEALTQCIKTLRRQLGDDAGRPRFIETVPKHGYRFIAPIDGQAAAVRPTVNRAWRDVLLLGAAGTVGGGMAGFVGGLIYGFAAASDPVQPAVGGLSVLLVILCVTIAVALMGAAGVSFGIVLGNRLAHRKWWGNVAGGALGGLIVGALVKLLGLDAFTLLFGHSPAGIAGATEGLLLGGAVGLSAWLAFRVGWARLRRSAALAALIGALGGALIALAGGRLMLGSLDLLARTFPDSRLRLEQISRLFGESGVGPVTRLVTSCLEGALFSACVVAAMVLAQRSFGELRGRDFQEEGG
jgi:DNA-binding winged helix-turn-helix (wHTH) protein